MGLKTFFERLFKRESSPSGPPDKERSVIGGNEEGGKKLVCTDCQSTFLFEIGEQRFYKMRGLTPPKRCPSCRAKRKYRK